MRKLIKAVVISCGIVGAGMLGYSSFNNVLEQAKAVQVSYDRSPLYITAAAENLRDGFKTYSLYHLEAALGKKEEVKDVVKLEEIAKAAEKVVDKYAKNWNYRDCLLYLANTLHEEQKMEIARNKLKNELEKRDKTYTHYKSKSFSYHLWMIYNLSLKETRSVEKTHEELRKYYMKHDTAAYMFAVMPLFSDIERDIPKGDSELVKKIKSYDRK
ncbi:MAG: hypothetical protein Q8N77_00460 [Nanoarchaeota archaeon]|nr:hypothetical protein [Nanoarchaeota archaeon]